MTQAHVPAACCVAVALLGVWSLGFAIAPEAPSPTGVQAPAGDDAPAKPFAPLTYFQTSCANCHGDYGKAYGAGFGAGLSDDQLREAVDEMAAGPGFAPLDEAELDVQLAYHRSLIDHKPFVVAWQDGAGLRGEVTPGASVTVGGVPAVVEGHTFHADTPGAIVARLGDATTTLAPPTDATPVHSHHQPIKSEPTDEHD